MAEKAIVFKEDENNLLVTAAILEKHSTRLRLETELPKKDGSTTTDGSRMLNVDAKYVLNCSIQG